MYNEAIFILPHLHTCSPFYELRKSNMDAYVNQACSTDGQLILLVAISSILGLGKDGVPGLATVATALTVATAPLNIESVLGYAVSLQVPILAMIDISAAYIHWNAIDWRTTRSLLPVSFLGMGIGQVLDHYMTDAHARIIVGSILLAMLIVKIWDGDFATLKWGCRRVLRPSVEHDTEKQTQTNKHEESQISNTNDIRETEGNDCTFASKSKTSGWMYFVGIFGGAAIMLTNSMGPILNVYLLSIKKLSPEEFIGTRAMIFCVLNVGKVPIRFVSGDLGWKMIPLAFGLGSSQRTASTTSTRETRATSALCPRKLRKCQQRSFSPIPNKQDT